MSSVLRFLSLISVTITMATVVASAEDKLILNTRSRTEVEPGTNRWHSVTKSTEWMPSQTCIVVCDMWDDHWCKQSAARVGEMAPRMNEVIKAARAKGVFIIHCPSDTMDFYKDTPQRKLAQAAPVVKTDIPLERWVYLDKTREGEKLPIDDSDGGCDCDPPVKNYRAWSRQHPAIEIADNDAITDSAEAFYLMKQRGIQNVIVMGVHTNMCVLGRPFSIRQMVRQGQNVVLMRDMTDTMYNPGRWPFVSHVRGTELFVQHVEKRICPTITSDQFIGGSSFAFSDATAGRKRLQIILLGDSTTEAKFPKLLAPDEPQFEDTLRILLAAQTDLPPCDVYNEGVSGEYIRRLLDTRYDRAVKTKPQADYIFIRYGINDMAKRENFEANFAKDFHELLERLRQDHPQAMLIPMTCIPFGAESSSSKINGLIKQIAADEKLPLFDIYPRYAEELKKGPNMLNYRRYAVSKLPENLKALATPYILPGASPEIAVLDNRLDGLFGHLPGWAGDRHPNQAGYHVIADETAKWLAPVIRGRK